MVRFSKLLAAMCIAIALLAARAQAEPQAKPADRILTPGTYQGTWTVPEGTITASNGPYGNCILDDNLQNQLKGKPTLKSERPRYGQVVFSHEPVSSDGKNIKGIIIVLDESGGTGKGYDTLYMDVNRNLDLSDDPGVTGNTIDQGERKQVIFEAAAKLPYNQFVGGNNTNIARLDIRVMQYNIVQPEVPQGTPPLPSSIYCSAFLTGHWAGEIDSNHGKIPFKLVDMSGDGIYGTNWEFLAETPKMGDIVQLALAGGNDFGDENDPYHEQYFFSKAISVAGKLYVFKPSESGDKIEVAPYTGPVAHLAFNTIPIGKTPLKAEVVLAAGETGVYWLPIDGKPFDVPAGKYKIYMAQLKATDSDGKAWSVQAMAADDAIITLAKGKTVTKRIGGQIKMTIESIHIQHGVTFKPGENYPIDLAFNFSTGETVGSISQVDSQTPQMQPKIVLKDEKGNALDEQSAGFG